MKICPKCKGSGPFGKAKSRPGGLAYACKSCTARQMRERERAHKNLINTFKINPCVDCGLTYPAVAMDFDHVRGQKIDGVSQMGAYGHKAILLEISKCDLICANCHRIRTESRRTKTRTHRRQIFNKKIGLLKKGPCTDCGGNFPVPAMEFDHVLGEKLNDISGMHDSPWSKVLAELAKCQLVCCNCHRVRTHADRCGAPVLGSCTMGRRRFKQKQTNRMQPFIEQGVDLLGKMPDDHIANKFGIDSTCVSSRRKKLGIPVYRSPEPWIEVLGTASDVDIAEQYGKHSVVVTRKRNELGISVFLRPMAPAVGVKTEKSWHILAGTLPDKDVASIAGITRSTVGQYRKRMRIVAHKYRKVA